MAARRAAEAKATAIRSIPASSSANGTCQPSSKESALGPKTGDQPPSAAVATPPPSHGRLVEAFRPAWASWTAGTEPCAERKDAIRASGAAWASSQRPRSCGLIRPSGDTAVASVITSPAPPTARAPRWTRCQSFAKPFSAEYWHIGETPTRFGNVTERRANGEKRPIPGA